MRNLILKIAHNVGPPGNTLRAQGIVAEILFYREAVKKIEAESPVFCCVSRKKCAQNQEGKKSRMSILC
jgi:hypothetical protein